MISDDRAGSIPALGTRFLRYSRVVLRRHESSLVVQRLFMKKGILFFLIFASVHSFGQGLELVEQIGFQQIKIVKLFGSEAFNVSVSHLKVSNLSDVDAGSLIKLSSYEMATLQFNSSKSEATGVNYGAASSGGKGALGVTLNTQFVKSSGVLSLDAKQSAELSKAINDLFVAYQTFKNEGLSEFAIRLTTSFGLELSNYGDQIGLVLDGVKYIIPESELQRLYSVVSKVK